MNDSSSETCTPDEISKARLIDMELAEANFEPVDSNEISQREDAAMKRVAQRLGLTVENAWEIYQKVSDLYPQQLEDTDYVCTSFEIEVARALDEEHHAIDRGGLDSMGLLLAHKEATKRVATKFNIGPAHAESIRTKVEGSRKR